MSLQQDIQQLRQLQDALQAQIDLNNAIPKKQQEAEQRIEELLSQNLPTGGRKPKAPTVPTKPEPPKKPKAPSALKLTTIEEKYGRKKPPVNIFIPWMFWGIVRKKELKQWQSEVDAENNKRTALYEQEQRHYQEQLKAYNDQCTIWREKTEEYEKKMEKYQSQYAKYQADLAIYNEAKANAIEKKRQENAVTYASQIAQEKANVATMQQHLSEAVAAIHASTILAEKDKTINLVRFVLDKLETHRADSLRDALNLYDEEQKYIAKLEIERMQHEERMRADQFRHDLDAEQRRWENQERSRREAQQQFEQWSHNQQMQALERERLREARRASDELEQIRKAQEKN